MKARIYFYTAALLVSVPLAALAFQGWPQPAENTSSQNGYPIVAATEITVAPVEIKPRWVSQDTLLLFRELLDYEPTVHAVHKQVVTHNDLEAQRFKRWHRQSRLKALLPDFNFGSDFSTSNNIDLDRGSSSIADQYISGPHDERSSWDVSISWDLADLIWSSAQTSIDSRHKITADLRREFLADANQIFYERRQTQRQVLFEVHETEAEHFGLLIRIDELTGLLDALTEGWFGLEIERLYTDWPEFYALWKFN